MFPSPLAGGEVVCLLKLPVNAVVPLAVAVGVLVVDVRLHSGYFWCCALIFRNQTFKLK